MKMRMHAPRHGASDRIDRAWPDSSYTEPRIASTGPGNVNVIHRTTAPPGPDPAGVAEPNDRLAIRRKRQLRRVRPRRSTGQG